MKPSIPGSPRTFTSTRRPVAPARPRPWRGSVVGMVSLTAGDVDACLRYTMYITGADMRSTDIVRSRDTSAALTYTMNLVDLSLQSGASAHGSWRPAHWGAADARTLRSHSIEIAELKANVAELRSQVDRLSMRWRQEDADRLAAGSATVRTATTRAFAALDAPARLSGMVAADANAYRTFVATPRAG